MPALPLVSVIIPAYNGQGRIARAVKSVFQQDYPNWEIVVISDDQQDYERILADQDIRSDKIQFHSTGRLASGAGNARNIGLDHARGDIIAQLDCDDAFDPSRISIMVPLVQTYGAAASQIEMIDEQSGAVLSNLNIQHASAVLLAEQVIWRCFHTMNVALFDRRKINHRYLELPKNEDYIFMMQMFNAVECLGFVNKPLYKYYKYHGSATNFSSNPQEIAEAFTAVALGIQEQVRAGKIHCAAEQLKQTIHSDLDLYIAAQAYFVAQAAKNASVKFHEIMEPFLQKWPLPQSLRVVS